LQIIKYGCQLTTHPLCQIIPILLIHLLTFMRKVKMIQPQWF
jgi:hypothetical protein